MEIFDAHHHVGSLLDASFDQTWEENAEHHMSVMDDYGIAAAAIMPSPTYSNPNGLNDTRTVNDDVARIKEAYPDRFPVAFGTVEPWYGEEGLTEVERVVETMDGVMWHNRWQRSYVNSPMVFDLVEKAAEHDTIVGLHAHAGSEMTAPWRVFNVTESFPDVQFLVLDALSGVEQTHQLIGRGDDYDLDNVVFDTALAPRMPQQLPPFVDKFGVEKVVFGTDVYSHRDEPYTSLPLEQLYDAGLSTDEERAILYENAARVFDLE